MKKLLSILFMFFTAAAMSQNVGVGETAPTQAKLQVKAADSAVIIVENAATTGSNIKTGLYFKTGGYYSGGISTIGTFSSHRMGFFTYGGVSPSGLVERMSILDGGIVGIGTSNPALGKLVVRGSVGATVAVFGDKAAGISLQSNLPSIGFNEYYNAGSKFLSNGYAGKLAMGVTYGDLGWYTSNASGVADAGMTLNQPFGISREGSMYIQGSDNGYIFKDRTSTNYGGWNLYANAGKASLYRYNQGGNTITIDSTGALGLQGVTNPTAPLSFASNTGNKIALWGDATGGHYGLGIQGSLMQIYSSASNADIALGYGNSASFNETMRITGTGRVGIGGQYPYDYQLHVLGYPNSKLLQLENTDLLDIGVVNTIMFRTGQNYTGAIKTVGTGTNTADLSFYTSASQTETALKKRMTIADDGGVLIGTSSSTNSSKLEVINLSPTPGIQQMGYFNNYYGSGNLNSYADIAENQPGTFSQANGLRGQSSGAIYNTGVTGFASSASGQIAYGVYGGTYNIGGTAYAGYFAGNVNYTGTLTNTSDATLKKNIQPLDNALTKIKQIEIKQYEYTNESNNELQTSSGLHYGVLAQQLKEIYPTLVTKQIQPIKELSKNKDGTTKEEIKGSKEYLGVNYMELIPILVKGMQEQQAEIETLKKKIEILEKK